jgi:hypothetical protein
MNVRKMIITMKNDTQQFDYLRLFGIRARNPKNELSIAESKGLKSTQVLTFCRITGLSLDDIATILNISRRQINYKMHRGEFYTKEADILLNVAKIIYEFGRLYPDIQDFWLLSLARREEFHGRSALDLSKTEIGRGRVLGQIIEERDDYFRRISKGSNIHRTEKNKKR